MVKIIIINLYSTCFDTCNYINLYYSIQMSHFPPLFFFIYIGYTCYVPILVKVLFVMAGIYIEVI